MVTIGGFLSAFGYYYEATVVALFPSLFIPIMVGTWLAQGKAVPFGAIGPLTIGSMCTPFYRFEHAPLFDWRNNLITYHYYIILRILN